MFGRMSLYWNLSDAFLTVRLGLWVWEIRCPSHPCCQGCMLSPWLTTADVDLVHLAKVVLARFLHCQVPLFSLFPSCSLWEEVLLGRPHFRSRVSRSTFLKARHLYTSFGILWHGGFVPSPSLILFLPLNYYHMGHSGLLGEAFLTTGNNGVRACPSRLK